MKKIICVLLCAICISLVFTGCHSETSDIPTKDIGEYYTVVYKDKLNGYAIVYDIDTKVMYNYSLGMYNTGTLTLLVNADGTPRVYNDKSD